MPFVQKELNLGANPQIQMDANGTMAMVPAYPDATHVNLDFLQFQNPNILVNNVREDILYMVALVHGQITVEQVPIGQGAGGAAVGARGAASNSSVTTNAGPGRTSRAASIARSGGTAGLLVIAGLLFLHALGAGADEA